MNGAGEAQPVEPPVVEGERAGRARRRPLAMALEFLVVVLLAVGLAALLQAFVVKPYRIPSGSMAPTLVPGQRVLVSRFVYAVDAPSRGDVIVFHPPVGAESDVQCPVSHALDSPCPWPTRERSETNFIKRIVALPGEEVAIRRGRAVVDGKPLGEEYALPCGEAPSCDLSRAVRVPPGHYFVLGDNRGDSDDSRFWGPVAREAIVGQAFMSYWPPEKARGL